MESRPGGQSLPKSRFRHLFKRQQTQNRTKIENGALNTCTDDSGTHDRVPAVELGGFVHDHAISTAS